MRVDVFADVHIGSKLDALLGHEVHASLHHLFRELHRRYAVPEQATYGIVSLEHGHQVTHSVELMSGGQASGSRANDGHSFASSLFGYFGLHPALLKRVVNDGALDVLDGDGLFVDAEHARALAGRRTHATRELGKVVGLEQLVEGLFPVALKHEVVPLGYDVTERAAVFGLTKRHAAVHAACGLLFEVLLDAGVIVNFAPVFDAHLGLAVLVGVARILVKTFALVQSFDRIFDVADGSVLLLDDYRSFFDSQCGSGRFFGF